MNFVWQLIAPVVAMCLAVIGSSTLLAAAGSRLSPYLRRIGPIQTLLLASVCVLALLMNANAWLPGYVVFTCFLISGAVGAVVALRRGCGDPLAHASIWAFTISLLAGVLVVAWWNLAFASRHLWMLEGTNHDLVFFYGGAKWAMQHPLWVEQATVAREWVLGQCGQGMQFIGKGCIVQRNGAYSLLALASSFVPEAGPNQVRAMIGTAVLFPVLGMLPSMAGSFGGTRRWPRGTAVALLLAVLCMLGTGMMLSVVNENIGTAMAGALLMMIVLWALTPMRSLGAKWLMLGAAAGCTGMAYGEAAVHACMVVALAVVVTAMWLRSWRVFLFGGVLAMLACAIVLNRMLPELIASYAQVSGIVAQSAWPSWYIQQPFWGWWLSAPFAGLLMTAEPAVNPEAVMLGLVLMASTAWLSIREGRWRFYVGLLGASMVLVAYVQSHGYQYGEHKLVQVLGPAWVALLAWLLLRHSRRRGRLAVVMLLMAMLGAMSAAYGLRSRPILVSHVTSGITHAFSNAIRLPQKGDEVVIDTSGVSGPERYVKQDFAVLELHRRGVRARIADRGDVSEGYSDALLNDSLRGAESPDWLLVLKQSGTGSALQPGTAPLLEDATFALFSLQSGQLPLAQAGTGWHTCEQDHCWTRGAFSLETFVPSSCKGARLKVDLGLLQPPPQGRIHVTINGGEAATVDGHQSELSFPLANGRSLIVLSPDWQVASPQALGLSADSRPLFANVSHARISCGVQAETSE
ncbi:hypothetical protein [Stenotrophomonas sp. S41]|uniref:hypothetical protein n=1 Tax=Stenotrophomonas sp. S41 TaxID=2767464 RepID=UPI00190A32B0|nr:hypothetical protein [Stenotrophomonas sp. S41]MBK0011815.1 hypothetical protein [Stenotrophomonas sp. S41]